MNWPNFFIVSAPKSGTTTLYEYFRSVPEVYMPSIKEPEYFAPGIIPFGYDRPMTKQEYLDLFKNVKNESAIGEASTNYLQNPESAKLIHESVPQARIIIILRDPVQRAYSDYLWNIRSGHEYDNIHDAIYRDLKIVKEGVKIPKVLESGLYSHHLRRYLDTFDSDQIKIIIFEDLILDVFGTVIEAIKFLGLTSKPSSNLNEAYKEYRLSRGKFAKSIVTSKKVAKIALKLIPNSSTRRALREQLLEKKSTKPKLPNKERLLLEDFYINDVIKLEKILKRSLPWFHSNKVTH